MPKIAFKNISCPPKPVLFNATENGVYKIRKEKIRAYLRPAPKVLEPTIIGGTRIFEMTTFN